MAKSIHLAGRGSSQIVLNGKRLNHLRNDTIKVKGIPYHHGKSSDAISQIVPIPDDPIDPAPIPDPYDGIDITKITLIKLDENMNPMPDHVYHYDSGQEAFLHFNNSVDIDSADDRYDMIVAEDTPGSVFERPSMFASILYLHKVHVKLKYDNALNHSLFISNYSGLFANCVNLETAIFDDDTVLGMPPSCFYGCTSLKTVRLPAVYTDHTNNYSIDQGAFSGCTSLEEITIPRTVEEIRDSAFANTKIKRLQFTNRLLELDDNALKDMHELEEVVFDPDLTWLDTDAANDTTWLSLGDSVFANCEKLKSITFPFRYMDVGDYSLTSGVKARPFKDSYLEDITFRNHIIGERNHKGYYQNDYSIISNIQQEAFNGCTHLKNVKLGFRFSRIDTDAFKGLSNFNLILDWPQGYTDKQSTTESLHRELDNITSETITSWGASDVTVSYTGFIPDHGSSTDDTDGNGYNHYSNS
jgi:hypothetical protein